MMTKIHVLVLGNDIFAQSIKNLLDEQNIPVKIDTQASSHEYDMAVVMPNKEYLLLAQDRSKSLFVINGQYMSNEILKDMVKIRINGFVDHQNPDDFVDAAKRVSKSKAVCKRLQDKVLTLVASV